MEFIADESERLDRFLARQLPEHSRSKLAALVVRGQVFVDGEPQRPSFRLGPGMVVSLEEPSEKEAHDLTPADIALDVRYEDDVLLVVNKPRGLATHPAASLLEPSLVNALLARNHSLSEVAGSFRPGIVHRLDKETTGLLVVAKTDAAHVALAKQIESKEAQRRYFALVRGRPENTVFKIDAPIGRDVKNRQLMSVHPKGKTAVTHVKVIRAMEMGTLVALRLETGRTHQIRVHMRSIGFPVIGDSSYGVGTTSLRLQLHAGYLGLRHPVTHEFISVFAEPPDDFVAREFATQEAILEGL